jgi:hypothetical protein
VSELLSEHLLELLSERLSVALMLELLSEPVMELLSECLSVAVETSRDSQQRRSSRSSRKGPIWYMQHLLRLD